MSERENTTKWFVDMLIKAYRDDNEESLRARAVVELYRAETAERSRREREQYLITKKLFETARDHERRGEIEEAYALYKENVVRFPRPGPALYERPAIMLERAGRYDDAVYFCEAIELGRSDPEAYYGSEASFTRRRNRILKKKGVSETG